MSFSFNFVPNTEQLSASVGTETSAACVAKEKKRPEKINSSFVWIEQEAAVSLFESFLQKQHSTIDSIPLIPGQFQGARTVNDYILRVQEESASFRDRNTDLVPGEYEGGLKVWECSLDMCRYFRSQNIAIEGHVLEMGCGHGLPGIFILKQAVALSQQKQKPSDCFLTFSDYNEFVINDVTMPNVAANIRNACSEIFDSAEGPLQTENWLRDHVAFGAGDWLAMSDLLLEKRKASSLHRQKHPALPKDGLYDCILASETTYSETSAIETAELLSMHLKPGKGIAYISTKRYYFGVGGGTKCLCDALHRDKSHSFNIETLKVYDNGSGNIRELLVVTSLGAKR